MKNKLITASIVLVLLAPFLFGGCSYITGETTFPTQTPAGEEGFAIYYTRDNIPAEQIGDLSSVALADEPLVSFDDIISYSKYTHEIQISASSYEKLVSSENDHLRRTIIFCVNKKPLYYGELLWPFSSYWPAGVTIMRPLTEPLEGEGFYIRIEFSTLSNDPSPDPRSNPMIMERLEKAGKLIVPEKGFAIYLTGKDIPVTGISHYFHIPLADKPLISNEDIVSYDWETHEIVLTPQAFEKINAMQPPVNGTLFVACVDGGPVYTGAFWTMASSLSYDGAVIMVPSFSSTENSIQITLGYPASGYFQGTDPRTYHSIKTALEDAGKLK